jgi:Uma2 family endonuclease
MLVQERLRTTVEEFERFLCMPENAGRLFELINGEIVEKMPTEEHGVIAINIAYELRGYVKQHKSGRVGVEVRHRMPQDDLNSRLPDLSFTTARRPLVREGSVPEMPDLAIEIQSPDDTITAMREKADYYLTNGARLVWLVYPHKRLIEVYRPDADIEILLESDTLTGGDVLPGFSMPVTDVFEDLFEE